MRSNLSQNGIWYVALVQRFFILNISVGTTFLVGGIINGPFKESRQVLVVFVIAMYLTAILGYNVGWHNVAGSGFWHWFWRLDAAEANDH
jgi:hypothetical protein